jgi:Helix-turn-helix domain
MPRKSKTPVERRGYSMLEVAEMFGLSESRVRAEVAAGKLEVVRIGQRVIVTPRAIDEWLLAQHRAGVPAERIDHASRKEGE